MNLLLIWKETYNGISKFVYKHHYLYWISLLMGVICINMANSKGDNRNTGAGYRTKRSMKSIECWNVGNKTFGYCILPLAIVASIAIYVEDRLLIPRKIILSDNTIFLNLFIFLIWIIACYIITENKLKHLV